MHQILLSINPQYVDKILSHEKKFEYRKNKCKKNIDTIIIYSTYPVMKIVGEVKVLDIIEDNVTNVWKKTKSYSGISKKFFENYFKGKKNAVAYKLGKITKYNTPLLLKDFGIKMPPQSFVYIEK